MASEKQQEKEVFGMFERKISTQRQQQQNCGTLNTSASNLLGNPRQRRIVRGSAATASSSNVAQPTTNEFQSNSSTKVPPLSLHQARAMNRQKSPLLLKSSRSSANMSDRSNSDHGSSYRAAVINSSGSVVAEGECSSGRLERGSNHSQASSGSNGGNRGLKESMKSYSPL
jgi:hypothetical protein